MIQNRVHTLHEDSPAVLRYTAIRYHRTNSEINIARATRRPTDLITAVTSADRTRKTRLGLRALCIPGTTGVLTVAACPPFSSPVVSERCKDPWASRRDPHPAATGRARHGGDRSDTDIIHRQQTRLRATCDLVSQHNS
jgi:hypothetical protein